MTGRARALRRNATPAEQCLWAHLRRDALDVRFRRQVVVGQRYILDFYAPKVRLAIEVGGRQHADRAAPDARRTAWLGRQGIEVMRFWNNEVLHRTDDVVRAIHDAVTRKISPPSPGGRGVGGEDVSPHDKTSS